LCCSRKKPTFATVVALPGSIVYSTASHTGGKVVSGLAVAQELSQAFGKQ
jgi:hypothetical protein